MFRIFDVVIDELAYRVALYWEGLHFVMISLGLVLLVAVLVVGRIMVTRRRSRRGGR